MRLFLALGPGDIVGARRANLTGMNFSETSIPFSEQLISYCKDRRIETLAISSNARRDVVRDGNVRLENQPKLLQGGGLKYHLSALMYAVYLAFRARRFKVDFAIVDSGTTHYFALSLFALMGIPVFVNLHNVLWPPGFPPTRPIPSFIRLLNAKFFRYVAAGAIGVSPECGRQIRSEARYMIPFEQYRCQFSQEGFKKSKPYEGGTFKIIFVGRVEKSKGIMDIVSMAKLLNETTPHCFIFEICGDGSAIPELERAVRVEQLEKLLIVRGRLERAELLDAYASADAVIVPTRSDFCEGMPQCCAEAILTGLPVITSQVTNAFDVIGPAIVKAEVDDVESYVAAIVTLKKDQRLRERIRSECDSLSCQFLDYNQSYPAAVDRLLSSRKPNSGEAEVNSRP